MGTKKNPRVDKSYYAAITEDSERQKDRSSGVSTQQGHQNASRRLHNKYRVLKVIYDPVKRGLNDLDPLSQPKLEYVLERSTRKKYIRKTIHGDRGVHLMITSSPTECPFEIQVLRGIKELGAEGPAEVCLIYKEHFALPENRFSIILQYPEPDADWVTLEEMMVMVWEGKEKNLEDSKKVAIIGRILRAAKTLNECGIRYNNFAEQNEWLDMLTTEPGISLAAEGVSPASLAQNRGNQTANAMDTKSHRTKRQRQPSAESTLRVTEPERTAVDKNGSEVSLEKNIRKKKVKMSHGTRAAAPAESGSQLVPPTNVETPAQSNSIGANGTSSSTSSKTDAAVTSNDPQLAAILFGEEYIVNNPSNHQSPLNMSKVNDFAVNAPIAPTAPKSSQESHGDIRVNVDLPKADSTVKKPSQSLPVVANEVQNVQTSPRTPTASTSTKSSTSMPISRESPVGSLKNQPQVRAKTKFEAVGKASSIQARASPDPTSQSMPAAPTGKSAKANVHIASKTAVDTLSTSQARPTGPLTPSKLPVAAKETTGKVSKLTHIKPTDKVDQVRGASGGSRQERDPTSEQRETVESKKNAVADEKRKPTANADKKSTLQKRSRSPEDPKGKGRAPFDSTTKQRKLDLTKTAERKETISNAKPKESMNIQDTKSMGRSPIDQSNAKPQVPSPYTRVEFEPSPARGKQAINETKKKRSRDSEGVEPPRGSSSSKASSAGNKKRVKTEAEPKGKGKRLMEEDEEEDDRAERNVEKHRKKIKNRSSGDSASDSSSINRPRAPVTPVFPWQSAKRYSDGFRIPKIGTGGSR
ncbi:hypothetical protein HDU76_001115 [Blyttiomyces sp. JEL0837]|nr:hypothetical protein HDU76_001115 [Blyttiomyces sp. JEL0837]